MAIKLDHQYPILMRPSFKTFLEVVDTAARLFYDKIKPRSLWCRSRGMNGQNLTFFLSLNAKTRHRGYKVPVYRFRNGELGCSESNTSTLRYSPTLYIRSFDTLSLE
jgi:hypothetical protein